jgi:C4-dicarboxylate-specific signal transduction histidine kinase
MSAKNVFLGAAAQGASGGAAVQHWRRMHDAATSKPEDPHVRSTQMDQARVARLTMMADMTASITHEISQPLAAIAMDGSAGLRWLSGDKCNLEEARNAFSRIVSEATRAGNVIRSLRALVKKAVPEAVKFDINAAIEEVLALAQSELLQRQVLVRVAPFPEQQLLLGDRVLLQQVLRNLVINANDAMSTITDRTKMLEIRGQMSASGEALIQVEDNGTGIDAVTAERIFDPFFTTKPTGMGIGLAICRSIIEAHGGLIWASAHSPHGTVFQFTVPNR